MSEFLPILVVIVFLFILIIFNMIQNKRRIKKIREEYFNNDTLEEDSDDPISQDNINDYKIED